MFNYFFGSDTRSLGFLEIVNKKVPNKSNYSAS